MYSVATNKVVLWKSTNYDHLIKKVHMILSNIVTDRYRENNNVICWFIFFV